MTQILEAIRDGREEASQRLWSILYEELRQMAQRKMTNEPLGHTLQPTALVHEAYLRLMADQDASWENRAHFFGAAAEAMRRILIERARRQRRLKHGGNRNRVPLKDSAILVNQEPIDLIALDEALTRLEKLDKRMSEVVKLHCFAGLSHKEIAKLLKVSEWTVIRDWIAGKTLLLYEMGEPPGQNRNHDQS